MAAMNPYKFNEAVCIAFSGGRSSGYMLRQILDAGLPDGSVVVFCNTGKEEEETLKFVNDCAVNWSVPIVWLEYRSDNNKFEIVTYETASRNGEPFKQLIIKKQYLPNAVTRFCTIEMKIRTTARYCKSIGLDAGENDSIVGFRADEPRRVAKLADKSRAPMYHANVTKRDVGKFWAEQDFDLELPNMNGVTMHGNCDLCFLKGYGQVMSLIIEQPDRADWWSEMETLIKTKGNPTGDGATFHKSRPGYAAMKQFTKDQDGLFTIEEDSISCFCGD
jgi:3'-phosphoadenosine 5'-phosphosulfate sulfotransferase (PAPS reductase)/FAD synthetase